MTTSLNLKLVIVNMITLPPSPKPQKLLRTNPRPKRSMGLRGLGIMVILKTVMPMMNLLLMWRQMLLKNLRVANCVVENAEKSVEKCVDEFADFGGNVGLFEKFEKLGGDCECFCFIGIKFFSRNKKEFCRK